MAGSGLAWSRMPFVVNVLNWNYRLLLLRNAGLALVAGMVAADAPVVDVSAIHAPQGREWLPAAMSRIGAAAALAMLRTASVLSRSGRTT